MKSTASSDHAGDFKEARVSFLNVSISAPKEDTSAEVCSSSTRPSVGSECH
jgi:hypothetical protein